MGKRQQMQWINTQEVMEFYSNRKSFDDYVSEGAGESLLKKMNLQRKNPVLGDKNFIKRIVKNMRKNPEHSRLESTPQFQDCETIIQRVSESMKVGVHDIIKGVRGKRNDVRNISIYIASHVAGFPHREIREKFNIPSDSGVSRVCQRMRLRLSEDKPLSKSFEMVIS